MLNILNILEKEIEPVMNKELCESKFGIFTNIKSN